MHDISLIDFSPLVVVDGTLTAVPIDKRFAIAERERLKSRDQPPMVEIEGMVLKRPISRIFEKEVYLGDPKLGEAENRRIVAVDRPHASNFHLYNYFLPETATYFTNKALTPAARARQTAFIVLMLAITLAMALLSLGFFQRGFIIGLIWLSPSVVFLSLAKHLWEQYRADRMLAEYVVGHGRRGEPH